VRCGATPFVGATQLGKPARLSGHQATQLQQARLTGHGPARIPCVAQTAEPSDQRIAGPDSL
jgi:hypothetical protein